MSEKVKIELVQGVEGKSIYINSYRICGSKPWGGGKVIGSWESNIEDVEAAIAKAKKEG